MTKNKIINFKNSKKKLGFVFWQYQFLSTQLRDEENKL